MPRALRVVALCAVATALGFLPLDRAVFGSNAAEFGVWRITTAGCVAAAYFGLRVVAPTVCGLAIVSAMGVMLLAVISRTGGVTSNYYAGLIVLFGALPVLLPLVVRQVAVACGLLIVGFCVLGPFSAIGRDTGLIHVVFLVTATGVSMAAAHLLDAVRYEAYDRQYELELARDHLAELDVAKSRFTANVHHELRTPLTLMLAPLEAIRGGDLGSYPANLESTFSTMHSNGLRLLRLINDLLDLAKIESEQLSIARRPIDVGRVLSSVVDGARAMADRKGVGLRFEASVGELCADPDALERIAVNLVGNALKFTDVGTVTISVDAASAASGMGPGAVHIKVQDTGMGIPQEQIEKIFDRFAQVDGSATRRHEGTGIGLSLVSELVGLHGGQVWAESEGEGLGATIHVVLPFGEPDVDPANEAAILADGSGDALSASAAFDAIRRIDVEAFDSASADRRGRLEELKRSVSRWEQQRGNAGSGTTVIAHPPGTPEVVVAEDNSEMRDLLCLLIGREFVVRPCCNGRDALDSVRDRPPMLVVTDVMMPEMSGTELCKAIKGDSRCNAVPVILVTSKAEREMKIEGLELGADDYVTKPFHPRELMARVRGLVRVSVLQREIARQNEVLERSNAELKSALAELKEAEVQLVQAERLAAVGELSAGVAHEVNNPLNFALNSLSLLRSYVARFQDVASAIKDLEVSDPRLLERQIAELESMKERLGFDELPDEFNELIGIVTDGLDRTSRLVGDLRDFAAPHRGSRVPVDLRSGLESTVQLMSHQIREARCSLVTDYGTLRPVVLGDPGAINQVFLNLLKNALEAFDARGGGVVTVRLEVARGRVCVVVEDDGPGMGNDVQSRLFEPFFTTKSTGSGAGLGLSMCRRIVEEHQGEIGVKSTHGEGTTFRVWLPLATPDGIPTSDAGTGESAPPAPDGAAA